MEFPSKKIFIFFTDLLCFFLSLLLVLILRHPQNFVSYFFLHLFPFSIFFLILFLIFLSFDLYEPIYFRFDREFLSSASIALILSFFLGLGYFYFGKPLGLPISPYTNFLIFYFLFSILFFLSRYFLFQRIKIQRTVIFVGKEHPLLAEIKSFLKENPHLGFKLKLFDNFEKIPKIRKTDFLVTNLSPEEIPLSKIDFFPNFFTLENFYIYLFRKIPIEFLDKKEILERISISPPFYYFFLKRIFDILISIPGVFFTIFFLPFIFVGIKLSSPGPIFIKQERVGQFGKKITIFKFRTMHQKKGAFWTKPEDSRIFPFGKFLRKIHIDEIPQSLNILKGDLTFIGPRAEFVKVVDELKDKIPYFNLRHLAKPGITGWAQLMAGYGSSVEDYIQKISYDLYYIANRNLVLDFLILLKTLKEIFKMRGR